MKNGITVRHQLYDGSGISNIPINYDVVTSDNGVTYKCEINMKDEDIPEWLTLRRFDIRIAYENGVSIAKLSEVPNVKTIDTALFLGEVQHQIYVFQKWREMHQ